MTLANSLTCFLLQGLALALLLWKQTHKHLLNIEKHKYFVNYCVRVLINKISSSNRRPWKCKVK